MPLDIPIKSGWRSSPLCDILQLNHPYYPISIIIIRNLLDTFEINEDQAFIVWSIIMHNSVITTRGPVSI